MACQASRVPEVLLVPPALLVHVGHQDNKDRGVTQVSQEPLDHVVSRAQLVELVQEVRMDNQDRTDGLELLDQQERRVQWDLQVILDHRDFLDFKDLLEELVSKDRRVTRD